jgi:hypothetical protein
MYVRRHQYFERTYCFQLHGILIMMIIFGTTMGEICSSEIWYLSTKVYVVITQKKITQNAVCLSETPVRTYQTTVWH